MRHYELTEAKLDSRRHDLSGAQKNILLYCELIKKDCQPYLQQNPDAVTKNPLYRGVKPPGGHSVSGEGDADYIYKDIRLTDRKPSDMPYDLHQFINGYFKQEYGASFRSAMFVTGSVGTAGDYGTTYIIFPTGEFQYLWSPEFEDLFSITGEYGYEFASNALGREAAIKATTEIKQHIADEVLSTYQTDDLLAGINARHEIMIRAKSYYGITSEVMYNGPFMKEIRKVLYG
jgi:hypothetical protein